MANDEDLPEVLDNENGHNQRLRFQQEAFLLEYLNNNFHRQKAAEAVGVTPAQVTHWFKDKEFKKKFNDHLDTIRMVMKERALQLAGLGEPDMIKFVLEALEPELFDKRIRFEKWKQGDGNAEARPIRISLRLEDQGDPPERFRALIEND